MGKRDKFSGSVNLINPLASRDQSKISLTSTAKYKRKSSDVEREKATRPENPDDAADSLLLERSAVKAEPNFNIFVGTEVGILKGISIGGELPISKNIYKPASLGEKPPAVTSLTWVDDTEKELLVGLSNHVVKTYNSKMNCFTRQILLDRKYEEHKVIGMSAQVDLGRYVYGLENGIVSVMSCKDASEIFAFTTCKEGGGRDLRVIRQCPADTNIYATGGKENDLKIWNTSSENPQEAVFKAKNVPHDELDLRVPVWVQDLTFLPRTTEVVVVGTRYGQIRLYDVRVKERPVSNVKFVDHPIMSITSTMDDRRVVVGTGHGEAGLYDLRNPGNEKLCLKFAGAAGSIRCVVASPEQPYLVSSGLDRHLYIHKLTERTPFKKLYLNQQINTIAVSKTFMKEIVKTADSGQGDDWANIPADVLAVNLPTVIESPVSKRVKKTERS